MTSAHILFRSKSKPTQQSGLDTARRLFLLPPAYIPAGPRSASPSTNAGSGLGSGAAVSVVEDVESAFDCPPGERRKYESALGVSQGTLVLVLRCRAQCHDGRRTSLCRAPGLSRGGDGFQTSADFIDGAQNNMRLGDMLSCGAVSPARFAKQLCSSRSKKPHSNLLLVLANWMVKIRSKAVAAGAVAAQEAGRLGKGRRSGGGSSKPESAGGDRDGTTDDSAEGDGDEEGALDIDEMLDVA